MACIIGALTQPGDTLAAEALTYPGLRALARLLQLRVVPIAMDEQGLVPDALEVVCRAGPVRALVTMPTLHNPTTATMPVARRQALAEVARRHGVLLIQDDVYGFLLDQPLPPLAHYAPQHGIYITSTSKRLMPAFRAGYVTSPLRRSRRLPPQPEPPFIRRHVDGGIVARWVADGTAERLAAAKRSETRTRNRRAREILSGVELPAIRPPPISG